MSWVSEFKFNDQVNQNQLVRIVFGIISVLISTVWALSINAAFAAVIEDIHVYKLVDRALIKISGDGVPDINQVSLNRYYIIDFLGFQLKTSEVSLTVDNSAVKHIQLKTGSIGNVRFAARLDDPHDIISYLQERPDGSGWDYYIEFQIRMITEKRLKAILAKISAHKMRGGVVVVVDPGHGGRDHGAISSQISEKDWTLKMSQKIAGILNNSGDILCILTREEDYFLSLNRRARMASEYSADLFISIHFNSFEQSNVSGVEIYYPSTQRTESNSEIRRIERRENQVDILHGGDFRTDTPLFIASILRDVVRNESIRHSVNFAQQVSGKIGSPFKLRGIFPANFRVLTNYEVPSVMIECGYLSSPRDRELFFQNNNFDRFAQMVESSIRDYFAPRISNFRPEPAEMLMYTVNSGDTLSSIARLHNLTLKKLLDLNQSIDENVILPGQKIRVR